jgi:hypothetical protein
VPTTAVVTGGDSSFMADLAQQDVDRVVLRIPL